MVTSQASAQSDEYNYDEAKVPQFKLPETLVSSSGERVRDVNAWQQKRRPELLKQFSDLVYGVTPETPSDLKISYALQSLDEHALNDKAIRKEIEIRFSRGDKTVPVSLLLYLPKVQGKVPAFLGLNFNGNHAVHTDPGIRLNPNWMRNNPKTGVTDHRATEATRGSEASRWPVELIVSRGYALATMYYGDIDPDYGENEKNQPDSWGNGIHPLFYEPGQTKPSENQWGSIGAWAWGLSRALDYLISSEPINANHVAVIGHSRLGKTSLWAGVQDERFALVISNNSGCGGAALSKRRFGETVKRINTSFPHWFCDNFNQFNDQEEKLPIDQHELLALVAPRALYVASAVEDRWADPRGEFLSAYHASPVYELFGKKGLVSPSEAMPAVDEPLQQGMIGYHIRSGVHDVTEYDWQQYLNFADKLK